MGGMTLGYFSRVPVPEPVFEIDNEQEPVKDKTPVRADADNQNQDFEKAFLTPWHLFF